MRLQSSVPERGRRHLPATTAGPIVFIVDDDLAMRESLDGLMRDAGWHVKAYASAADFLAQPRLGAPCCLVLDITLPDLSGLDLQRRIAADGTGMPIIFITGHGDVPTTVEAMKAGAVEFLTKPFGPEVLLEAVRQAIHTSETILGREAELRELRKRHESLSGREREVMALVVTGLMNKQVGGDLGISEITVKAHRGRLMRKMQARSLAELVTMAASLRLAH